jgi:hypothetical protein
VRRAGRIGGDRPARGRTAFARQEEQRFGGGVGARRQFLARGLSALLENAQDVFAAERRRQGIALAIHGCPRSGGPTGIVGNLP